MSVAATAMASVPAGLRSGAPEAMTRARVTVTAFRARTRSPWNRRSPSSVASSTTRNTARFASQYAMNPSTTRRAVAQLASSDQSPSTSSARVPAPSHELLGHDENGLLHVLEVLVEGGRRRPGLAGDVDDLDRPPRRGGQQLGGALEQAGAGGQTAPPRDPSVGGGDRARVVGVVEDRVEGGVAQVRGHRREGYPSLADAVSDLSCSGVAWPGVERVPSQAGPRVA